MALKHASQKITYLDAEILLAHLLHQSREYLASHPGSGLSFVQQLRFSWFIRRHARGIPVAYLTGHKEFYGLDFIVNTGTLIPRPETELMVELVLDEISNEQLAMSNLILIDIGTGSGCIPIAIMKTLKHENIKTLKQIIATDISKRALIIAKENARRHNADITFLHGNLLDPLFKKFPLLLGFAVSPQPNGEGQGEVRVIVMANLPYLTQNQFDSEPSIQHEPKAALVADKNGLALYEKLLQQIRSRITIYDLRFTIFIEIDPSQSAAITTLTSSYLTNAKIEIKKDLAGRDRVVSLISCHK